MAKKDKKKAKQQDDDWDKEFQTDVATTANDTSNQAAPPPEESNAEIATAEKDPVMDDLADNFGGLMAAIKKSKGKKGKKPQVEMVDANEALEAMDESPSINASNMDTNVPAEKEDAEDAGEFRVKTKKEKEKEKKEKEKAKKKAQADKKKAGGAAPVPADAPEPEPEPEPANEGTAEAEEDEGTEETAASKSKKKKKKPAAKKEEPVPAPAAAKRKGPNISALQKRLAAQQAAEEAHRKAEEEEKARIEAEERRLAEEEARKEEEKRQKKEREKAKREDLRKKGLLLSKKQKEQARLATLRHEQLLAAGNVTVAGLSGEAVDGQKSKRPVYGNKRKGKKDQEKTTAAPAEETPVVVKSESGPSKAKTEKPKAVETVKSEPAEEEEVADTWEEAAADSWEDQIDEHGNIIERAEKPKKVNGEPDEEDEEEDEDENESEEDSDEDSDDDEPRQTAVQKAAAQKKADAAHRREEQHKEALAARSKDNLRSPICCILGHVDTGKTKLLDKIRQTNVQEGEAGGITQQIGATYFPLDAIKMKTEVVNRDNSFDFKIPGLLIIDTPGHESFTNLRSRGSSLCNIAILVIDIMHGLEPQTLESIRLLRARKTPFIVALNKIDRIYGWNATPNGAVQESLAKQTKSAQSEFRDRCNRAIVALQEQGLNSILYWENKNLGRNVSIVPTSAHTGEGIPDMLMLLVKLTQERMTDTLMYLSELECTVLEVKVIEGLGTTIDVILSNGVLHEGDRIVLCGLDGAIITTVRALLTPEPMKEMRVKSAYVHHKEVKAALGVKITAQNLSNAIAGSRLLVVGPDDDEEDLAEEVMGDLVDLYERVTQVSKGVFVQASTLGSLEALLEFLKTSNIPVAGINIGPVHKKDIMRCGTMTERAPEFAVLLCFDVKIDKEAEETAAEMGVKIFSANIIYHLFDSFTAYQKDLLERKRKEASGSAVFPCALRIIQIFRTRDPIILGVDVIEGSIRVGTPLAAVKINEDTKERTVYSLGKIFSIEQNHKALDIVKKGQSGAGVAIKVEGATQQLFGRHIDEKEILYSHITRHSIDTLKLPAMKDDVTKEEWALIIKLKTVFGL